MRYRSIPLPASAILSAMVALACGGGTGDGSPASAPHPSGGAAPATGVSRDNPCSVMLPSEVGEILGATSTMREVVDEVTCHYIVDPPKGAPARDESYAEVKVHWTDGRTAVAAARMAGRLLGGGSPGEAGFEKVPDLGDEAWVIPYGAYLAFAKGDVGVEIDLRLVAADREKAVRIAKLIASRI